MTQSGPDPRSAPAPAAPGVPRVQDLSQFRTPPGFRGRAALVVQLWWLVQALLFAPSPKVLFGWRRWLLRAFGARIGKGVLLRPSARILYPWFLDIADRAWIGDDVELYSMAMIRIGHDAVVSQRAYLCTGSHDFRDPAFPTTAKAITIAPEAWVAADVFIHPGVTVGRGAVIAARATLCDDAEDYGIYAGAPAVKRGDRRDARAR